MQTTSARELRLATTGSMRRRSMQDCSLLIHSKTGRSVRFVVEQRQRGESVQSSLQGVYLSGALISQGRRVRGRRDHSIRHKHRQTHTAYPNNLLYIHRFKKNEAGDDPYFLCRQVIPWRGKISNLHNRYTTYYLPIRAAVETFLNSSRLVYVFIIPTVLKPLSELLKINT